MKITFEQLLSFRPYYPYRNREHLLSITGGREEIEVSEIPYLPIHDQHIVWLLIKILGTTENGWEKQHRFAEECAGRSVFPKRKSHAPYAADYYANEAALAAGCKPTSCYKKAADAYSNERKVQINKLLEYIGV